MSRLKELIGEAHRRSLWQVLSIYLVGAWLGYEVVQALTEGLGLPAWFPALALVLFIVGLPIVVATAVVQEGAPVLGRRDPTLMPETERGVAVGRERVRHRGLLTWRSAIAGGVVAFALWGIVAAGWLLLGKRNTGSTAATVEAGAAPGIAVLPFRVVGPELELWREGMVDILSTNLEGAAGLRKIDPRIVLGQWARRFGAGAEAPDPDAALDVARASGASFAVMGSAVQLGEEVRITADVHDLRDRTLMGAAQIEGSPDSVLALVDRLTFEVLRTGLIRDDADLSRVDLSQIGTRSLPALKAYLQAEQVYRHYDFRGAIEHLTRALAADSTFALAMFRMAEAYAWLGRSDVASEYVQRAAALSDRLPERQALLLRGSEQYVAGRESGITTLEELTRRYPDDVEGWFLLGDAYYHIGDKFLYPRDKTSDAFRRVLDLDPSFPAYSHLIAEAFNYGDSTRANQLIEASRGVEEPGSPAIVGYDLAFALARGDAEARAVAEAALDTAPTAALERVNVTLLRAPEFAKQLERVSLALRSERHRAGGRTPANGLIESYLMQGRMRDAVALERSGTADPVTSAQLVARHIALWQLAGLLDAAAAREAVERLAKGREALDLFLAGAFAASEGPPAALEEAVGALEALAGEAAASGDSAVASEAEAGARGLRGYAALVDGDVRPGVEGLKGAARYFRSELPDVLRYRIGQALLSAGALPEARTYLESVSLRTNDYGSAAIVTPTEYYLGRLHEELGDPERAALHYGRFVRWWEDCDPELRPFRERGRAALARLAGEPAS